MTGRHPQTPARWQRPLESCMEVLVDTSAPCQVAAASGVCIEVLGTPPVPLQDGSALWTPASPLRHSVE